MQCARLLRLQLEKAAKSARRNTSRRIAFRHLMAINRRGFFAMRSAESEATRFLFILITTMERHYAFEAAGGAARTRRRHFTDASSRLMNTK